MGSGAQLAASKLLRVLKDAWSFRGGASAGPGLGAWLVIAGVVELFGMAMWPRVPLAPWLGPAVLGAAIAPVVSRLGSGGASWKKSAIEYALVFLAFAGVTWWLWGFAIRGRIPIDTGNHRIMFERARAQLEALRAGRWLRWTNLQQGGDSLTDLYPFAVNFLLYAVHALTTRTTPLIESYTIFVAVVWWLRLAAVYTIARRFAGIPVALVLAVASGFDIGNDVWDGTWHGAVYWGMVHSNVALSAAMLAMAAQVDLVRGFSSVRFVVCALTVALTIFAHPLGIIVVGVTTVAYVAAWAGERELRRETLWVVVASGLGLLLASSWVFSFAYGQKHFGFNNAAIGIDMTSLGNGLYDGGAPNSSFRAWTGFVAVAALGSLLTRDPALVGPALTTVLFVLLSVMEMTIEAGTFSLMPGLLDGQPRRMLSVAKCVATPAAAWLFQRAIGTYLAPTSLAVRQVATRAVLLLILVLGPGRLFAAGGSTLVKALRGQVEPGSSGNRERAHTGSDYRQVFDKVAAARVAEKSPTPFRLAINWTTVFRHAAWGEGYASQVPVVDFVNAAANFLRLRPRELSEQGFHDWNIRFLISDRTQAPFPHLTERMQQGRFTLFELDTYDDRFVVAPPGVEVSGLRVDEGHIEFDVRGAGADGVNVTVRSAWYPRWRATKGASRVRAVNPHPGAKPGQDQLGVHVRDGHVVLDCDGPMPGERPGYVLSLLGTISLGVLARARGRTRTRDLLERVRQLLLAGWFRLTARADRQWLRAAGGVTVAVCLWLVYERFGRRDFLLAPPFVPGPNVRVGTSWADAKPCQRQMLSGSYSCARQVTVYSAVGSIPVRDDTGEFPRLFAGVGVNYGVGDGTTIRLDFSRVAAPDGRIAFRYDAYGDVRVELRVDGRSVGERRWSSNGTDEFTVPRGNHQSVELVLVPTGPGALNFARIDDR